MSSSSHSPKKIINSFLVVGINELKLQKYTNLLSSTEESQLLFIQNINIVYTNIITKRDFFEINSEKWMRILNNQNVWLRFQYEVSYIEPITDLKIQECDLYNKDYLILSKDLYDEGYRPIPVMYLNFKNINIDFKSIPNIKPEQRSFPKLDKKSILIPIKYNIKHILNLPCKKPVAIILINRKTKFLPLKQVDLNINISQKSFNFCIERHKSPYSYKYLPEILDIYPLNENKNPSIALFCFPDGVKITDKFETPKCFNFVLTDELGKRTFGSVIIFSQEIDVSLENYFTPTYTPDGTNFFIQKAICVLSFFPFYYNSLLFLKEIYNITEPKSKGNIPIERAVCTFVDSLYLQSYDKLLRFNINNKNIDFYRIPNYGKTWDTSDKYIETLFRLLSYDNIITAWEGLLLEKKLYIICSSKNCLSHIAHALIDLLFPFKWIHVYVPILPEQLKLFIESPVPLIIGIFFHIDINELPQDSLILNVNKNCFENYKDKLPLMPSKLNKILFNKLSKLKEQYNLDNPIYVDNWLFNQDEALIYLSPDNLLFPKIDTCEIRDTFFSFFLAMFKNYDKFFVYKKNITGVENVFLKDNFLKEHNSSESNSFLSLFCETALFSQIINAFNVEENNVNSSFAFFIESIKKGKEKIKKYYLSRIIPKNVIFASKIEIGDLNGKIYNYTEFPKFNKNLFIKHEAPKVPYKSRFSYAKDEWCFSIDKLKKKEFPKFFLYLIYDIWFTFFSFVLNIYEDNQAIILMDYALFLVEYLNNTLKISPTRNLFSKLIKACARSALNPFVKQLLLLVKNVNKNKSRFNSLFHNEYLNGLYFLTENVNINNNEVIRGSLTNSTMFKNTMRASVLNEMKKTDNNIQYKLKKIIFLTYNLCENCLKKLQQEKLIFFYEILSGFISQKSNDINNNNINSICSNCLNYFEPKIFYIENDQENLDLNEMKFLSPMNLVAKIDNIIKEKGEIFFYKENEWEEIFFNIIFYFELFDLPTCVLYVQNNMSKFEKIKNDLKENKKRKLIQEKEKEKKNQKIFFFQKYKNKNSENNNINNNDISFDKNNSNSNISTNNYSDISITSFGKQYLFSSSEMDIWKIYQLKKINNKNNINNNNNINNICPEDKNEIIPRINEMKNFLGNIMNYFCINSQEKLKIFLEKYDKKEHLKKHDFLNMQFKKENDKYNENNLKNSDKYDKFSINANLNVKINTKDILQIEQNEKNKKNLNQPQEQHEKYPIDNLSKKRINNNNNNNINQNNSEFITKNNNINEQNNNRIINIQKNNININRNINNQNKINPNVNNSNYNPKINIPYVNNNLIFHKTYTNKMYNNKNPQYPQKPQNPIQKNSLDDQIIKPNLNSLKNNIQFNPTNQQRAKQYTVRQVNTYKSIFDNE